MSKADLMQAQRAYYDTLTKSQEAEADGRYTAAIAHAVEAWDYLEDMMRYERRYEEQEFDSVPCIDLVLKYAPLLFDQMSLNRLDDLLQKRRSIQRNTDTDLKAELTDARQLMRVAHRLWDCLERRPDMIEGDLENNLGGSQDQWECLIDEWEMMGLLRRTQTTDGSCLRIISCMDEHVRAICSECGVRVSGRKYYFLSEQVCPRCRKLVVCVICPEPDNASAGE